MSALSWRIWPALFLLVVVAAPARADDGWGTLKGRFVLTGDAPELSELNVGDDLACHETKPVNQKLVLSEEKEIANVIVYLRLPRGESVRVHPDYEEQLDTPVELNNKGCTFVPRVVLVRTGQELIVKNGDPTSHNVKGELGDEAFNFILPEDGEESISFDEPQRLPRPIQCNIHTFMKGWMLVRDDPYMAVSAEDGRFEIANMPAGEYEFQFWHEMAGYLKGAKMAEGELDRRGRIKIVIPADGEYDMGDIEVAAENLEE